MAFLHRLTLPAGLRLLPTDRAAAFRAVVLAVLGVCLFIAALDLAFGALLPAGYREFYTMPLWPRVLRSSLGAIEEELLFRLLLTTALAALPLLWGKRAGPGWIVAAIVLAQLANVHALVLLAPPWGMLRYWLVGCVWGWLYWRHGLVSALIGHGTVHLALDPLLLGLLA